MGLFSTVAKKVEAHGSGVLAKVDSHLGKGAIARGYEDLKSKVEGHAIDETGATTALAQAALQAGVPYPALFPKSLLNSNPELEPIARNVLAWQQRALRGITDPMGNPTDAARDVLRMQNCRTLEAAFGTVSNAKKVMAALQSVSEADWNWYEALRFAR